MTYYWVQYPEASSFPSSQSAVPSHIWLASRHLFPSQNIWGWWHSAASWSEAPTWNTVCEWILYIVGDPIADTDHPPHLNKPGSIAWWLECPLGVQEAGVQSPTVIHHRRKSREVCASQLAAWHQRVREPTGLLGVSIMVWVIHFCWPVAHLSRCLGTPKLSA